MRRTVSVVLGTICVLCMAVVSAQPTNAAVGMRLTLAGPTNNLVPGTANEYTGRLTTSSGPGVPNQRIVVRVDGQSRANVATSRSGTYSVSLTFTATPATHLVQAFVYPGSVLDTRSPTLSVHMVAYPLSVTRAGTGSGTVTSSPPGIACGLTCTAAYTYGTVVSLTPAAAVGSLFAGWSGACAGTGACAVSMTSVKAVTATFDLRTYPLTASLAGSGKGSVTSTPAGISCGSTCSSNFTYGTAASLSPSAALGSTFTGWSGACTGTGACTVTMAAAQAVTATFTLSTYSLSVTRAGSGNGEVDSSLTGISCGATCSASYTHGAVVSLTATAETGSTFAGWSGACSGTGACTVTMTAANAVTATFTLTTYPLSVTLAGSGNGTVDSSPAGIACGGTCSSSFDYGTTVTLTATAQVGSTFTGWSGACSGTGACTVPISAATAVTATFTPNTYPLSVTRAGSGSGTVTSNPAAISCGSTCAATVNNDTVVNLTAIAQDVSTFAGWSGACTGTGACNVTVTAATDVTATFTLQTFPLSVTVAGSGSGTVTSSPAGISCTPTCLNYFDYGTTVTLTSTGAPGSTFTGWTGDCTGTGPCTVTLASASAVTATFSLPIAVDDSAAVDKFSGATTIDVLGNDTYDAASPISVESVTQPANGTVAIADDGADLTYTPNPRYCNSSAVTLDGPDTFTYTIGGGSSGTVSMTVNAVRQPPRLVVPIQLIQTADPTHVTIRQITNTSDPVANKLIGVLTNQFDASGYTDPNSCDASNSTLAFHWVISYPAITPYADAGISGYRASTLSIQRNALLNELNPPVHFLLTTSSDSGLGTTDDISSNVASSSLTRDISDPCQGITPGPCAMPQALPPTEPT